MAMRSTSKVTAGFVVNLCGLTRAAVDLNNARIHIHLEDSGGEMMALVSIPAALAVRSAHKHHGEFSGYPAAQSTQIRFDQLLPH